MGLSGLLVTIILVLVEGTYLSSVVLPALQLWLPPKYRYEKMKELAVSVVLIHLPAFFMMMWSFVLVTFSDCPKELTRFDHHCVLMSVPIALHNHRPFLQMLFYASIALISLNYHLITMALEPELCYYYLPDEFLYIILTLIGVCVLMAAEMIAFLIFHCFLVCKNSTTRSVSREIMNREPIHWDIIHLVMGDANWFIPSMVDMEAPTRKAQTQYDAQARMLRSKKQE